LSLPSAPSDRADGAVGKIRKNVMVSQPLAAEQHLRWLQHLANTQVLAAISLTQVRGQPSNCSYQQPRLRTAFRQKRTVFAGFCASGSSLRRQALPSADRFDACKPRQRCRMSHTHTTQRTQAHALERHHCSVRPQLMLVVGENGASTSSRIACILSMSRARTRCSHQLRGLASCIGPVRLRSQGEKKYGQNGSRLAEALTSGYAARYLVQGGPMNDHVARMVDMWFARVRTAEDTRESRQFMAQLVDAIHRMLREAEEETRRRCEDLATRVAGPDLGGKIALAIRTETPESLPRKSLTDIYAPEIAQ
jgi:hypothetical protein